MGFWGSKSDQSEDNKRDSEDAHKHKGKRNKPEKEHNDTSEKSRRTIEQKEHEIDGLKRKVDEFRNHAENSRSILIQRNQEIERMRKQLEYCENRAQNLETILPQRDQKIKAMTEEAEYQRRQFHEHVDHLKLEHDNKLTQLVIDHSAETDRLKREHQTAINDSINATRALKQEHITEREKLRRQLLAPTSGNQDSWADDKLKTKFKDLQHRIQTITSERVFSVAGGEISPRLDPTNFCTRLGHNGPKKYRFVLQSLIWRNFETHFFSLPFGFGVLGPEQGKRTLMNVFFTFRKLFDGQIDSNSADDTALSLFKTDKLANKWRCATFTCIQEAITTGGTAKKLSQENRKQTFDQIMKILTEVSQLSSDGSQPISSGIKDELRDAISISEEIGFQLGIHAAQLQLVWPSDRVVIGDDHWHCEDADRDIGDSFTVDLAVVPSLQKIGDGVSQFSTRRSITPSEFYPDRS